jgi:hypothetical protein
MYVFIIAS